MIEDTSGLVVSLCDLTGNMVRPFAEAGFSCVCVDIQHSIRKPKTERLPSGGQIEFAWGDVRSWTPDTRQPIAIVFAFPPCTDLTIAGARDFETKRGYRLSDALELFDSCHLAGVYSRAPFMIENPRGRLSTHRRPPDHTFDPCDYGGYLDPIGDQYVKKTCLWTGGGFVMPPRRRVDPVLGSKMHFVGPGPNRANIRSATPTGFARAVFEANVELSASCFQLQG